ncbi:type II toxin-antitoxin system VapC family toxin [Adonisia turfae]|uniref:type II toxin-antitoxin system VapC family toxin n=1 Tax=Adonisia turfae TaxID=2950184 RepID=UPI0013D85BB6|nr:type II toxin-antitoxin system VapC family toxin [Adonisia turfae]
MLSTTITNKRKSTGRNYRYSGAMLHSIAFDFDNRSTLDQILRLYKKGRADFSDYLIGAALR